MGGWSGMSCLQTSEGLFVEEYRHSDGESGRQTVTSFTFLIRDCRDHHSVKEIYLTNVGALLGRSPCGPAQRKRVHKRIP